MTAVNTGDTEGCLEFHRTQPAASFFLFFGASSSGKTQDFGSCIRRFESSRPSHKNIKTQSMHLHTLPQETRMGLEIKLNKWQR